MLPVPGVPIRVHYDSGEWREMLGAKDPSLLFAVYLPFSLVSVLRDVRAHVVWELVSLGD